MKILKIYLLTHPPLDNQKQHLSEFFFGGIFFKLFLHWSWNVRQVFHHLLIYRFYHQHRKASTHLTNLE